MVASGSIDIKKKHQVIFGGLCTFFSLFLMLSGCGWNPFTPSHTIPFQNPSETIEENEIPQNVQGPHGRSCEGRL